jgi:hypothetical protein
MEKPVDIEQKRPFNEREIDEIISIKHFVLYLNNNPDVKDYELWDGLKRLESISNKYLLKGIGNKDIDDLMDLEDMKELVDKFFLRLTNALSKIRKE